MNANAPQPKPIRFARLFGVVVASVVGIAFAVVYGWFNSADFAKRSGALVVGGIQTATGQNAEVDDIAVNLWPPGVSIGTVAIQDALTNEPILTIDGVQAPVHIGWNRVSAGRVVIDEPEITLHINEDGTIEELRGLKGQGNPMKVFPWRHLAINNGRVTLVHPQGEITISELTLDTAKDEDALSLTVAVAMQHVERSLSLKANTAQIGGERVHLPAFQVLSEGLTVDGTLEHPLQGDLDVRATIEAHLEDLQDLLLPPRAMAGQAQLDVRVSGTGKAPRVEVAVLAEDVDLDVPGKLTPVLHYHLDNVQGSATWTRDGADIHEARMHIEDGAIVAAGHVTPNGELRDGLVRMEALHLRPLLQSFDAAPTPWVNLIADAEVHLDGTLQPLSIQGTMDLAVADLHVGDRPIQDPNVYHNLSVPHVAIDGSLHLTADGIHLQADTFDTPYSLGWLSADIGFQPRGPLDLYFSLDQADLRDFAPLGGSRLKGTGLLAGHIFGPFNGLQFEGSGDLEGFEVVGVPWADRLQANLVSPDMRSIELQDARALRGDTRYGGEVIMDFAPPLSMHTDLIITSGRTRDLLGMFLDVPGVDSELSGTVELSGPLYDMDGEVHLDLNNASLWGEAFTDGAAHGYMDDGVFTMDALTLTRRDAKEGLHVTGTVGREWVLDGELVVDGTSFERLDLLADSRLPLSGNISLQSAFGGTLFEPEPRGRLAVTDVRYDGFPVDDNHITFHTENGTLYADASLLGGSGQPNGRLDLWIDNAYSIQGAMDELPLHAFYPVAADGDPITAHVSGDMSLVGTLGESVLPTSLQATLTDVEVEWSGHRLTTPTPWILDVDGSDFAFHDIALEGGATAFNLSVQGGDVLDLEGSGVVDLDMLRAVVPGVTKANGLASISAFAVGSRPNVEAVIEADVDLKLLRQESVPATFEDLSTTFRVTRDGIDIGEVRGQLGGGFVAGYGTIDSEGWLPRRYDLNMTVDNAQIQWIDSLPPAIGDATLTFDGPVDQLLLSGDVTLRDMSFSDRIEWEDWVVEYREAMLVDTATDYTDDPLFGFSIDITGDETIRLRNNVAEGIASANLRVIGDTVRPGLAGLVEVKEGIAFLQDRQFRIDRGLIQFNDPWTWDPDLDFVLNTDIESREQRYRVDYEIYGPFSNWSSRTRSDPGLPQADVNALLWFGATTQDLEEMGALPSALTQAAADLILTDFLITGQAGDLGGELPDLFDRIDLTTGVNGRGEYSPDPHLVVEKRLTDLGDIGLRWELNLVRPDDLFLTLDRRIGGIWSLRGWYASLQRDLVLPIGGAYGVDVTARWEAD